MPNTQQLLDRKTFETLPLHDARFLGLMITPVANGAVATHLRVALNEQEDFGTPVRTRDVTIIFEESRSAGYAAPEAVADQGVISSWGILPQSPIIDEMKRQKSFGASNLTHYWFDLSSGSRLDIVAAKVSLAEG